MPIDITFRRSVSFAPGLQPDPLNPCAPKATVTPPRQQRSPLRFPGLPSLLVLLFITVGLQAQTIPPDQQKGIDRDIATPLRRRAANPGPRAKLSIAAARRRARRHA